MVTPAPRGARRHAIVLLALTVVVSTFGSVFLPSSGRLARAADGVTLGDALILAGPGGQYGILTVAPTGSSMSVDGDAVDGYYPVTFDGVSGWTATGLIEVSGKGGGTQWRQQWRRRRWQPRPHARERQRRRRDCERGSRLLR